MDLRSTQIKDTFGNLVTIGSVAGTPTTGTLQNGAGSDITSLTLNGAAVVSGNIMLGNTSNLASGTGVISQLQIASVSASLGGMMLQNATNNNGAPAIYSTKTRSGTIGNYTTAVVNGDFLMFVDGEGSDGVSALRRAGSISINAAGTFTPTSSPGYITFNTTPSGSVSTSERLRIDSAGNVGIGTSSPSTKLHVSGGNIKVDDTYGIDFSATPGTGTSELFDDYEEGTWTATLASGATTTPTGLTAGFYTKVGRVVNAVIATTFGSITVNGTPIVITGLPFAAVYGNTQTAMGTTGRAQYQASAIHAWQIESSTELHAIYIPANTGNFSDLLSEASGTYTPTFYVNITYMA